jgi:Short C-terminal domain
MPGLLRGVARTAAVAGTATAVSNRVSRRQANRWSQQGTAPAGYGYQEAPPEPAYEPAPAAAADPIEQLQKLGALHDQGILTDDEFDVQKRKILNAV